MYRWCQRFEVLGCKDARFRGEYKEDIRRQVEGYEGGVCVQESPTITSLKQQVIKHVKLFCLLEVMEWSSPKETLYNAADSLSRNTSWPWCNIKPSVTRYKLVLFACLQRGQGSRVNKYGASWLARGRQRRNGPVPWDMKVMATKGTERWTYSHRGINMYVHSCTPNCWILHRFRKVLVSIREYRYLSAFVSVIKFFIF